VDAIPLLLLLLIAMAVTTGTVMILLVLVHGAFVRALHYRSGLRLLRALWGLRPRAPFFNRPSSWLAVKSRTSRQFRLHSGCITSNPAPGLKGWAGEQKLFLAPPLKGVDSGFRLGFAGAGG